MPVKSRLIQSNKRQWTTDIVLNKGFVCKIKPSRTHHLVGVFHLYIEEWTV